MDRRALLRAGRPGLESLETRQLLAADPVPFEAIPASTNAGTSTPSVTSYDALAGFTKTRQAYGVDGSGLAAAVIDTGVNYNHPGLGGGFGSGKKVEGGYDFAMNDGDPNAATWDHGTAVAGLIASDAPGYPGVAPGADIVALRVFGDDNKGDFDRVADALQWVLDHHSEYNITVVNLSISDGANYTMNWFTSDGGVGERISTLIGRLKDQDIPVVSATGNSFAGKQGVGFTSIIADTVSVTATDESDRILSIAQRLGADQGKSRATDLAAPGKGVVAPVGQDGFMSVEGTSFAAPMVSGSILLLQQIYQSRFGVLPKVDDLVDWLKKGATPIQDSATGITIGRLDVAKAASFVPAAPTPPAPNPAPKSPPIGATPEGPPGGKPTSPPASTPPSPAPPPQTPAPVPQPVTPPVTPSNPTPAPPQVDTQAPPGGVTSNSPASQAPPAEAPPTGDAPTPPAAPTSPADTATDGKPASDPADPLAGRIADLFAQVGGTVVTVHAWEPRAGNVAGSVRPRGELLWTWMANRPADRIGAARPTGTLSPSRAAIPATRAARWSSALQARSLPSTLVTLPSAR